MSAYLAVPQLAVVKVNLTKSEQVYNLKHMKVIVLYRPKSEHGRASRRIYK